MPPFARISTRRNESFREASVFREMFISKSSSSSWKYAEATLLTRLDITAFWPHSVASRLARAASVALRNFPQKSNSQNSERLTPMGLVSYADVVGVLGKRWLLADAPPAIVGNWSARMMPSAACA